MKKEMSAGFIIFKRTRSGIRYLLLRSGGNYWNCPKGHIEKNENDLTAAFRETREETGLKQIRQILGFKRYEKYFLRRGGTVNAFKLVIYFIAEARGKEQVRVSDEHEEVGWFSFADATKKMKYKESRNRLQDARSFLKIGMNPAAQKIYALTQKIPKGKVSTYGAIANACGAPYAGRFVGFVLNKNTDPAIPCHRVIASDGTLGGYNKGVSQKAALLKKEGVAIINGRINLSRFGCRIRA